MKYLSIKNYETYQHYKQDWQPPWIKLYNRLLDDYAFLQLSDETQRHLMCLWLLASRHQNRIPNDVEYIARAIHAKTKVDLQALIDAGFVVPTDSEPVRKRKPARKIPAKKDSRIILDSSKKESTPDVEIEKSKRERESKRKQKPSDAGASTLDRLPKADCDALFEAWGKHWPIDYGRFRKALLVAHQAGLPTYTLQEKLDAIEAAFDWWEAQPPREQKFWSLDVFVRELPKWVDYGKMPNSAGGVLTERGRWIMGHAA